METTFRLIKFKKKKRKRYFYSLSNFTQKEIILVTTSTLVHFPSSSLSNFSISPLQSRNFAPFPLFLTKLVKSSQKIGRFSRRLTFKESRGCCSILVVRYSKAVRSINNGCNQSVIIATRHNHGRTISHKQCNESWRKWATTFDPCDTGTWYEFNILDGGQT